jgi:hypothetical protein
LEEIVVYETEVTYTEDITEQVEERGRSVPRVIGKRNMRCKVRCQIKLREMIARMGVDAARSTKGKSQDGYVLVQRAGKPEEVSREMKRRP